MTRFLVDAQLPRRLARALQRTGLDVVHTLDLPLGNATPDSDIKINLLGSEGMLDMDLTNHGVAGTKTACAILESSHLRQPVDAVL